MTKALPFTENGVERVVNATRKSDANVGAVLVKPDGSILVLDAAPAPAIVTKAMSDNLTDASPAEIENWS